VLELRLSFKQLAVRIVQGEDVDASRKALRELAQSMFSDDVNNDETDLICEAFRGVETVAVEQVHCGVER
jgi:mediator of RNA polymerase II transcription subunit 12